MIIVLLIPLLSIALLLIAAPIVAYSLMLETAAARVAAASNGRAPRSSAFEDVANSVRTFAVGQTA